MKRLIDAVNWQGALFLLLTPPAAIILTILHLRSEGFVWQIWVLFAVFYTLTAGSITAGYHRLFSHRTYEARPWLKIFYAFFGGAAFQNSILIWARDHRVHHRFVDTDLDPYSINKGFWYAHLGWMLTAQHPPVKMEPYGRDLERDPIVMFQHKYYVPIAIIGCFGVPTLIGYFMGSWLGGLAVGGFLRVVAVHHMTFFINSWCHFFGGQTYTDTNTARDSIFMAVATFGEGYHNFHHIFAEDYRNGIRWYHWDPTKWMIQTFRVLGLAHSLKRAPQSEITRLQLEMEEKHLKFRLENNWQAQFQTHLDSLKIQIESAQQRFEKLRAEYKQMANDYAQSKMDRLEELKFQIRVAKIEFRAGLKQWRAYNSFLLTAVPVKY
ncbi:MAG: fatty acid desaturase [Bdellovibrionales bacterium]